MRRLRAFSFVELLITMVIMGILGIVVLTCLWLFWGSVFQSEDQIASRGGIEYAFQKLGKEITNVSLGMPNNRLGVGTFADAFRGMHSDFSDYPVMGRMGVAGADWGGPVTLASFDVASQLRNFDTMVKTPVSPATPDIYIGPQLYYAWAEPILQEIGGMRVPVKVRPVESGDVDFVSSETKTFQFAYPGSAATASNFRLGDGRSMGLVASAGRDMRSWVTFPTLRIPMRVISVNTGANSIELQLAPHSSKPMRGILGGYEELYVIQACRLYINTKRELVQEIFGSDYTSSAAAANTVNILARNVAGMFFRFDQGNRLLTMYLAIAGGDASPPAGGTPISWPSFATPLPSWASRRRIEAQSITWRIRN